MNKNSPLKLIGLILLSWLVFNSYSFAYALAYWEHVTFDHILRGFAILFCMSWLPDFISQFIGILQEIVDQGLLQVLGPYYWLTSSMIALTVFAFCIDIIAMWRFIRKPTVLRAFLLALVGAIFGPGLFLHIYRNPYYPYGLCILPVMYLLIYLLYDKFSLKINYPH